MGVMLRVGVTSPRPRIPDLATLTYPPDKPSPVTRALRSPAWLFVSLLAALLAAGCAEPAPSHDTRPALRGVLSSPAWESHVEATPFPTWRVGAQEPITWGLVNNGVSTERALTLELVVPEGWSVVSGPTTYQGTFPEGDLAFTTVLEARSPGDWTATLRGAEEGGPLPLANGLALRIE